MEKVLLFLFHFLSDILLRVFFFSHFHFLSFSFSLFFSAVFSAFPFSCNGVK